jgi:hypothetical protein
LSSQAILAIVYHCDGHTGRRRGEGWLVAGRFTTELKFKTAIKAKKL